MHSDTGEIAIFLTVEFIFPMSLLAAAFCPFTATPDTPKFTVAPVLWDNVNKSQ